MNFLLLLLNSSFNHLPDFIFIFLISFGFLFFFIFSNAVFLNQKYKRTPFFLISSVYINIGIFIFFIDVLVRIGIKYNLAILFVSVLYIFFTLFSLVKNIQIFLVIKKYIIRNKVEIVSIFTLTILSSFLLSKFIFQNGLHDEWQHYAVIESMIFNQQFPIVDELNYGLNISSYYHYGWYYLVIFIKLVSRTSTETALDITKIVLYIPIVSLIYFRLKQQFRNFTVGELSLFSIAFLFLGPSLFLIDAYSQNVLFGHNEPIVYQPLFFQLAGITWFGLIYCFIFSSLFFTLLKSKKVMSTLFFSFFSIVCMFLLNKAYLFLLLFIYLLSILYIYSNQTYKLIKKNKLMSLTILFILFFVFLSIYHMAFPLLFKMGTSDSNLYILRELKRWGLPYDSFNGIGFLSLISTSTIKSFGLLLFFPFIYFFSIINNNFKKKEKVFILVLFFFSLLIPYLLNLSKSVLALNKFYIPFMSFSLILFLYLYEELPRLYKKLILFVIILGLISPAVFFSSVTLKGEQIYWNYSDNIILYLEQENTKRVVVYEDLEYGKFLINNLDIQLVHKNKYQSQKTIKADYIITNNKNENYELVATTDLKYLYKIR